VLIYDYLQNGEKRGVFMNPFKDSEDRSERRYPFDDVDEDMFEQIFDEMQRMFEGVVFKETIEDVLRSKFDSNKHFIYGYRMKTGTNGKPKIREFGNFPKKPPTKHNAAPDEQDPLVDVIEGGKTISVTVEIPGAKKEDIELKVTENALEINVNSPRHNYHRRIPLPYSVKEQSAKATYKNGVFDVVIKRKKKRDARGHKVNID